MAADNLLHRIIPILGSPTRVYAVTFTHATHNCKARNLQWWCPFLITVLHENSQKVTIEKVIGARPLAHKTEMTSPCTVTPHSLCDFEVECKQPARQLVRDGLFLIHVRRETPDASDWLFLPLMFECTLKGVDGACCLVTSCFIVHTKFISNFLLT